jgi:hypothetical protein
MGFLARLSSWANRPAAAHGKKKVPTRFFAFLADKTRYRAPFFSNNSSSRHG